MQDYDFLTHDADIQSPADSFPELQTAFETGLTNSSGNAQPSRTFAGMFWDDTTNNVRKQRNQTDTGWTIIESLDPTKAIAKTTAYQVVVSDFDKDILVDTASGPVTITLPVISSAGSGFSVRILNTGSSGNEVTIDGSGAETISGDLTQTLTDSDGARVVAQGSEWKIYRQGQSAGIDIGAIMMFGAGAPDASWLECDFSAVSRTTYSQLYAYLGTVYGIGDGSSTFNLPDLRGRSPMGAGQGNTAFGGGSGTNRTEGDLAGTETHQLSTAEMPVHSHANGTLAVASGGATNIDVGVKTNTGDGLESTYQPGTGTSLPVPAHAHALTGTVANAGSGSTHNITSPSAVVAFFIKALP